MTYIYLVENCHGDPNKVYIGKTKNNRYFNHKKTFGEYITYTIIDEINSLDRKNWKPLESYWIEQFRQWGFHIMNKQKNGGSGPEFLTSEQKQNISQKLKNRKITWSNKFSGRSKKIILQYDLEGNFIKEWPSIKEAASYYKLDEGTLCCCLKGRQKTCGKYKWKYKI
jgi:hypothetical protein